MHIEIKVEDAESLGSYASIPIAYRVIEVLDVDTPSHSLGGVPFASGMLDVPVLKDYDAQPGNHPLHWPARFDVRGWTFLAARMGGIRVGGAIVVRADPDIEMLEGGDDLALHWDIRVAPAARSQGVGTALRAAAESWARAHGAHVLKVETQNTNVPACRFYARHGFVLRTIRRDAYREMPDEVQLLWYKDLDDVLRPG